MNPATIVSRMVPSSIGLKSAMARGLHARQSPRVAGKSTANINVRQASFKAAVLTEFGKPLEIRDVKVPKLKSKQVLINIQNAGLNASDILISKGMYDFKPNLPFTPGFEVSGDIAEVGSDVEKLKVGDRVVCVNKLLSGGFAQQCVAPIEDVWRIPSNMKYKTAAALVDCYATAYLAFSRRVKLEKDSVVLVTAAAGGLGLAAVDVASNVFKAKVIGVCGNDEKADLVREKGGWSATTYSKGRLAAAVSDVCKGKGIGVVFDACGGDVFLDALECAGHEATIIVAGFASRQIPTIATSLLLPQSVSLIGLSLTHYREADRKLYRKIVKDVIELAQDGIIEPHVSITFKLDQINEAFQYNLDRKSTGKVILDMTS